ncbi:MAG: hypothetical protein RL148_2454 [Planctomycetota bacterium]
MGWYPPTMRAEPVSLRHLHRLCFDVVQRSPTAAELRNLTGAEPRQVVERLVRSREAMSAWFEEELYYFLLLDNFRPRGDAVERIPARLQQGEMDVRGVLGEILLSTGFSLRNPGNDTFVTVVLEQCLGYRVQDARVKPVLAAGKRVYDGRKDRFLGADAQTQADLIRIVLEHVDCTRHLLSRHHQRLLGAPLPADAPEVAVVHGDPKRFWDVLTDWLVSPAYVAMLATPRTKNERQFLRGMWQDLLERTPGPDEMRNLRNAMQSMADPAPLRSVLAKVVLDSGQAKLPQGAEEGVDPATCVTECFRRFLARDPVDAEREAFVKALREQGATRQHVVRALVGSLEYRSY